ncbi:MAG: phosphoribosylaminoimidazolesuccinocarboxamide synthase [Candidatus Eisenbacteria bacterium]|uniref:Phosphoribosylaminoimidazole-succinocarboxamide synthase n=1 Tax=Eiseniibacteriota bacterium TaxID=2212470 RepID=A0A538TL87_UNCEI|nr:MAG: phosphoribosylaminoimidazolesuccinocarboxamide synthase [Candidatus Eisenbacteria bacterium]
MLSAVQAIAQIELPGLRPWRRGKVRSVYEAGPDHLVIVASDRLSAYDSVLPTPIPAKGQVLTHLSSFWFQILASAKPHHFVSDLPRHYPAPFPSHAPLLEGRSMLVRRAKRIDIECVVRGYLTGSGFREYQEGGLVCGIRLKPGLTDGSRLDPPIFTPATKEESGHDQNITFEELVARIGRATAEALSARSVAIYNEARRWAWDRGLVLADTKLEFGLVDGTLTLIDEVLSPDSSRYWDRAAYEAGRLESFDKQLVRDWLDRSGWNHEPPAPALPDDVVRRTSERYLEAMRRLTGAAR